MTIEREGETSREESTRVNPGAADARFEDRRTVEQERRVNALQSLVSQNRSDALAGREKVVGWWLTMTAMFLTLLGVMAVLFGYVGYRELTVQTETATKSAQSAVKAAHEAQDYADDTRATYAQMEAQLVAEIENLYGRVDTRTGDLIRELDETAESAGESELELRRSLASVQQMVREARSSASGGPSSSDLGRVGVKTAPGLTFCRNALIVIASGLEDKTVRRQSMSALEYCRKVLNSYHADGFSSLFGK